MLNESTKAPSFTLKDQDGNTHSLDQYAGKWILLYFYPKDMTPGCTKEACMFRDYFAELKKEDVVILGVSKDSVASHKKFAEKESLPFPLLSDESTEMIQAYDAWAEKSMFGKKYMGILRISYLIGPDGKIAKAYKSVKPAMHAKEVLDDVMALKSA